MLLIGSAYGIFSFIFNFIYYSFLNVESYVFTIRKMLQFVQIANDNKKWKYAKLYFKWFQPAQPLPVECNPI